MKVDIVFPAASRPEFTTTSLLSLAVNTDWSLVRRLIIYTDGAEMAPCPPEAQIWPHLEYCTDKLGGPVAIMKHWLGHNGADVMAKIDNDVVVPPGWLNAAVGVMEAFPELDILGLEPPLSRTPSPGSIIRSHPRSAPELDSPKLHRHVNGKGYAPCTSIGGVGLMRRSAFTGRAGMVPHDIYGGFTEWQIHQPRLVKGWIVPPLDLFLLDRMPIEPWASLSRQYIARGDQRPWTNYRLQDHRLWDWFLKTEALAPVV